MVSSPRAAPSRASVAAAVVPRPQGGAQSHGLFSRLHLRVTCATEFGQTVHVSGSSFMVGKQDPSAALEMVTTPEEYPVWRTRKPIIVPRNEVHTYMYALFEGGKFNKWETLSTPRRLRCTVPLVRVHDTFDDPGSPAHHRSRASLSEADDGIRGLRADTDLSCTPVPARAPHGSRLFLVCFHLPITLSRGADGRWQALWNESLIAKTENSVANKIETFWVGTISMAGDSREFSAEEQGEITALLKPMRCTPIFVPPAIIQGSYLGYCKQILWPAFHNIDVLDLASCRWTSGDPTLTWDQANTAQWFEAFRVLNQTFADHMVTALRENDVMWVHDYHLMLLPKMVADAEKALFGRRRASAVFFMHIPFPTSQIFRALAHGELLLQGMLSANIVGFHSFDHARHFLNAGKRLLGLSYQSIKGGLIGVEYDKRTVMVVMSHVGIEPEQLDEGLARPETAKASLAAELRAKHGDRIIIGGLDVCQKLSGVSLKLLAFERLLTEYPVWRNKVVLVQRCLLPETRVDDEEQTAAEVAELTQRIQAAFGANVLDYSEAKGTGLPLPARMALYLCSDVLACTAVREGLNLYPLEYIYAHSDPRPPGVVLASEFSACSSLLNGAVRINPFDVAGTAAALDQALTMEGAERSGRRARDLLYISSRPSAEWTHQVLCDMWAFSREASVTHMEETMGFDGDLTHEMSMKGFTALKRDEVVEAYRQSKRRVLLLDYGGTLLEKEGLGKYLKRDTIASVTGRQLGARTEAAVRALCADLQNTVFIISGLHPRGLLDVVFDYGVDWEEVKSIALPLLNKFTAHTNGSSIKIRDTGLAWSYYSTDPEWGGMQAKQLALELEVALAAHDTKVQHVRGQIEVVPMRLHKGVVAKTILRQTVERRGFPDFVLCLGDDVSDEHMFTSVYSFLADVDADVRADEDGAVDVPSPADDLRLYICTVGKKKACHMHCADEDGIVDALSPADDLRLYICTVGKKVCRYRRRTARAVRTMSSPANLRLYMCTAVKQVLRWPPEAARCLARLRKVAAANARAFIYAFQHARGYRHIAVAPERIVSVGTACTPYTRPCDVPQGT
ncbi:trehalose 6-phosphate phosphatase [Tribonema minus]|uniref:Trehalose 6-phosphate phosphatase n=1 Tax=Tribonema minus TaxID=303371 RepID=A0A835Z7K4_9STRA|nr:trehalose 6-phosphate phosphatase [Tribonema minus]